MLRYFTLYETTDVHLLAPTRRKKEDLNAILMKYSYKQ